jgi:hypothetical protein
MIDTQSAPPAQSEKSALHSRPEPEQLDLFALDPPPQLDLFRPIAAPIWSNASTHHEPQ